MIDNPPGHPHVRFEQWRGRHVVIKTGHPADLRREAHALSLLGKRAVDVVGFVEIDDSTAELVTARLLPGDDLRPLARADDDAATRIIGELITAMRADQDDSVDPTKALPDLSGVLEPLGRCRDSRLPEALLDAALRLGGDLVKSGDAVTVHGDLQHRNVARRSVTEGCRWIAIDPHGWWGDASFESVALLVAPESLLMGSDVIDARGMSGEPLKWRTRRRIEIIAEITGDDLDRLWSWAFVGAVIAEARMITQHDLVHGAPLALAQTLVRVL